MQIDILERLTATTKINGAYPRDIADAIEELIRLRNIEYITKKYLKECNEDYEDSWITRETLHKLCSST